MAVNLLLIAVICHIGHMALSGRASILADSTKVCSSHTTG